MKLRDIFKKKQKPDCTNCALRDIHIAAENNKCGWVIPDPCTLTPVRKLDGHGNVSCPYYFPKEVDEKFPLTELVTRVYKAGVDDENQRQTKLRQLERVQYKRHDMGLDKQLFISKVIFNDPATIVFWRDGSKTVVKCQEGDTYDKEKGLAMAFVKKYHGNSSDYYDHIRRYLNEEK